MPFYEKGPVRIHYEEAGSGFPLLVIPGGGLNSTIEGLKTHPFNQVDKGLANVHRGEPRGVGYTVGRDFVRECETPLVILPDDVPGHPYAAAPDSVQLAPDAQVSLYPWEMSPLQIQSARRHVGGFL